MILVLRFGFLLFSLMLLQGCATSRYALDADEGPGGHFDASAIPDAVPVNELKSLSGNGSPYTVRGQEYEVLASVNGYQEQGIASWYGAKFHGYKTSNGEVYSMYSMTAAHKTLPLPSFVKVTNLDNNKSVVVRVNDRGPFHEGRIIDLSYAAALKLDYANKGTARVEVTAIVPEPVVTKLEKRAGLVAPSHSELYDGYGLFVQVGAFGLKQSALNRQAQLKIITASKVHLVVSQKEGQTLYRVWVGPFFTKVGVAAEEKLILDSKIGHPLIITRPLNLLSASSSG